MLSLLLFYLSLHLLPSSSLPLNSTIPTDALSLLAFKYKSDLSNKLPFILHRRRDFCRWVGIKCAQGRVVRLVLEGFNLQGVIEPNTISNLDQLRVLSLQNNSLTGPIPNLSKLINLKSLFLNHNSFSGFFPLSVLSLYRIQLIDLSYNNLTGVIPIELTLLDRINYIRLDSNRFNGTIPPLNQSVLQTFNVSDNSLTGAVPVTPALIRFDFSCFSGNPGLCGEILKKICNSSRIPFFGPPSIAPTPNAVRQSSQQLEGVALSPPSSKSHRGIALHLGFSIGVIVLVIGLLLIVFLALKKRRRRKISMPLTSTLSSASSSISRPVEGNANELELKVKKMEMRKSGNLVFCRDEEQVYSLDQLMTGSAELLGRGSIGTTYKAVLDNRLIVCVKRLDVTKTGGTSKEAFERHIQVVSDLRHPNLVPIRAYFQAKEEKLIIYDYQSNGSLFSLIHGLRSTRAKPLHWTSCLKIVEDVAQGLAYIQGTSLVHGNLKASNVLLGADFEACLADYCLGILFNTSCEEDTDSAGYRAPEVRKSSVRATSKSDVYAFGVLLLELLTSKPPSQHPFLMPADQLNWVRHAREEDGGDDYWLAMLLDIATACNLTSPEQRPTMWQVLGMIQEIKESASKELDPSTVFQ